MIDAKELRIGNYIGVAPFDGDDYFTVDQYMIYNIHGGQLNGVDPIPITPDWLERLGFEKGIYGWEIKAGSSLELNIDIDGIACIHYGCIHDGADASVPILHIHQLQNLFFALTGTELTIKRI